MASNQDNSPIQSLHGKASHFQALINREGRLNLHENRRYKNPLTDLYHYFFSLTWPKFFIHLAAIYFAMNLLFAGLYFIDGVDMANLHSSGLKRFSHCFILSVENMSAVEYGRLEHV